MSMLDFWLVLLVGVLLTGIIGRRRLSQKPKLWLWRAGFIFLFVVSLGDQQNQECIKKQLGYEACIRAPITVGEAAGWVAAAVVLYVVYRYATRRLRRADSVASVGDDPGGAKTGSRWPLTMSRPQVVAGLCIGAAVVSSLVAYALVVYWPSEDVGMRLRRECESIIRETGGDDLSDYQRELRIRSCIEARARGGR